MSIVKQAATQMELADEAGALLRDDMTPRQAIEALLAADEPQEAVKLLARLLPKRYAVAWLCQCARDQQLSVEDRAGVSLAEHWVREPNEANRRAAFEFANAGNYESLGAWLAASAGWADGSLAPAKQETPVPPAEHLTAVAAVAAVNMLAALAADQFDTRRLEFIKRAMDLLGQPASASGRP
ncbi:MAG: hypothetical protein J0H27_15065 [Xanthomonadales bacterium]|nr:hypothetical protein [Xanthomonadales bacterium]ODU91482.1 MAG: hypothetical protein ABT18_15695 [Rhodanobacter sp. SCN 66-43]OJY86073.1 MAG: hypothetical protein BGP23_05355 [Xanthomonadales bacterium 66-474]